MDFRSLTEGHWQHDKTGKKYKVLVVANTDAELSRKDEYPITVVYQGTDLSVWTRGLGNFLESFHPAK